MARPAQFTPEQIVDSATEVAAKHGPSGTTIARIASALGAPTGSIYHRFASRDIILGEVWLRTVAGFQSEVLARLNSSDAKRAGLAAVRFVPQWVREHPGEARILLRYRSADFLESGWPPSMSNRAKRLRSEMTKTLCKFCRHLLDRDDAEAMQIISFALADAPLAAVRRHVNEDRSPPPVVDELVDASYRASLSLLGIRW